MLKLTMIVLVFIELPQWARTKNYGPNCLWACVNTLARLHDIHDHRFILADRIADHNIRGYKDARDIHVEEYLKHIGANYKITQQKNKDKSLLEQYGSSYGVVVSFYKGFRPGWVSHAVLVIEYTDTSVTFWDPNFPTYTYKCTRRWFDYWWSGGSLVILPK